MEGNYWIESLKLQAHPEGGFYKETYRSNQLGNFSLNGYDSDQKRNTSTAIYFLLRSTDKSLFHKIKSDEIWHYHTGSSLLIYTLSEINGLEIKRLGLKLIDGDFPQIVIPANTWFGALVEDKNSFTLSSCTVAPGFDFNDFELADRKELLIQFSNYKEEIKLLTK